MAGAVVVKKDWWSVIAAYLTPRMLIILAMGFASGLPLLLTLSTLSYWLSKVGVDKTTIGLFALVGTPYTFKFLWSPVMDQVPLPILTRLLGRRRSWLLLTQALLTVAIFAMGLTDPATDPVRTAVAALVVAFLSASQDIVIDAYRIDLLPTEEQGHGAGATQVGYRFGLLLAGAGALALSDYVSWSTVFTVLAVAMAASMVVTLLAPEPKAPPRPAHREYAQVMAEAVIDPFAYDGLAEALKTGDEYAFDYMSSVNGFWSSTCALMRVADAHGGADFDTRSMIHTIGVSFTVEMAAKAAYEETVGHATAWIRGDEKTLEDKAIAATAIEYAAFLRQTPWYQYPFRRELGELWSTPTRGEVRSWERRFGIGLEFAAKAAYARVIGGAVAATAPAKLTIRSVVTGMPADRLRSIPEVTVIGPRGAGFEIETPRYDLFTKILVAVAARGGTIQEIAGNDDIMVTLTAPAGADVRLARGTVLHRMKRDGFASDRLLVGVKVPELAAFLRDHPLGDPGLEHIFDY